MTTTSDDKKATLERIKKEFPYWEGAVELEANPKDLIGAKKAPLRLVPPALIIETAAAMKNGAEKYGPYNWREKAVSLMTYIEAAQRHLFAFADGEDFASDSGVHHLAHAAACMAIVMDAMSIDKLIDDRPTPGAAAELLERQNECRVTDTPSQ